MRAKLGVAAIVVLSTAPVLAQDTRGLYMPTGTIAPTDPRECDALQQRWDNLQRQYSERHQSCLDAHNGSKVEGAGGCSRAPCLPLHGFPPPEVRQYRDAQLKSCRDAVAEYQRRVAADREAARRAAEDARREQERERAESAQREADRRKADEERRNAAAKREQDRKDARDAAERDRQATAQRRKDEAERERQARAEREAARERGHERERVRQERIAKEDQAWRGELQRLITGNQAAAEQAREQRQVESAKLDRHANDVVATSDSIMDRIASVIGDIKIADNLLPSFGNGGAPEFDLGDGSGDATVGRALDGADLTISAAAPIASLPFALFRNVVEAQLELQDNLFRSLSAFERGDSTFLERDFVTEFGERAFGPRAFLGTMARHSAVSWVSERYVVPTVRSTLYPPVDPPRPRPVAHHFWSARSGPVTHSTVDAHGAAVLFDRTGAAVRSVTAADDLEHTVATTNARPRYSGHTRWERNTLVWSPSVEEDNPWWMETPADPAWWVTSALEDELDRVLERLQSQGGAR